MNMAGPALPIRRELTLTRDFDAPRELVYKMWTDGKHLAQWFGPREFTNPIAEVDPRVGGRIHIVMRSPWNSEHPMEGVFREVVKNEKLVFTNNAVDEKGGILIQSVTTVTFEDHDGMTRMTMHTDATGMVDIAARMLDGMKEGWSQSFDKLSDALARQRKLLPW
jgi:uncharacterized protein YndB with AHSA1/START domain